MALSHSTRSTRDSAARGVRRRQARGNSASAGGWQWLAGAVLLANVAANANPLPLAQAQRVALCREPGAVALFEEAASFDELAVAAGALPDVQLRFGLANLPIEGGGFRAEPMTQAQLGVRQAFPPAPVRAAATRKERALADERRAQVEERRRSVLLAVRGAWLDGYLASRQRQLVLDSRALFADLAAITRSLYTVGDKNQQDVLRAELERSQLEVRLVGIEQQSAEAGNALGRWIGDAAKRPLAELSAWSEPPSLEELTTALADHPVLTSVAAKMAGADAEVALARARYRPSWTLDAAYGYRDGGAPDGSSRSDFVSVSATLQVPMFTANRQDRALRAAQGRHRAVRALGDESRRRLRAQLREEHGRWVDLGRRLALYQDAVLAQTRAHAEASLAAYRSETADFADVMRGHINDLEARLDHLRLRVDRRRSQARLAYLGGFELIAGEAAAAGGDGCQVPASAESEAP